MRARPADARHVLHDLPRAERPARGGAVPVGLVCAALAALLVAALVPLPRTVPLAGSLTGPLEPSAGQSVGAVVAVTALAALGLLALAALDRWGPPAVHERRGLGVAGLAVASLVASAQGLLLERPWPGVTVVTVAVAAGLLRLAGPVFAAVLTGSALAWFGAAVVAVLAGAPPQGWVPVSTGVAVSAALAFAARTGRLRALAQVAAAEESLMAIDVQDNLTSALNRRGLELVAGPMIEHARRQGGAVSALFVDVDGLGRVNAALGVDAGDTVLRVVADRLAGCVRATDVVCRWAGDEFVVVGPGTGMSPLELERRTRAALLEEPPVDTGVWDPRLSAGSATLVPWDEGHLESLLDRAQQDLRLRRSLRRASSSPPREAAPTEG